MGFFSGSVPRYSIITLILLTWIFLVAGVAVNNWIRDKAFRFNAGLWESCFQPVFTDGFTEPVICRRYSSYLYDCAGGTELSFDRSDPRSLLAPAQQDFCSKLVAAQAFAVMALLLLSGLLVVAMLWLCNYASDTINKIICPYLGISFVFTLLAFAISTAAAQAGIKDYHDKFANGAGGETNFNAKLDAGVALTTLAFVFELAAFLIAGYVYFHPNSRSSSSTPAPLKPAISNNNGYVGRNMVPADYFPHSSQMYEQRNSYEQQWPQHNQAQYNNQPLQRQV